MSSIALRLASCTPTAWLSIKAVLALVIAFALTASPARAGSEPQCMVEGEPVQWVADYCMLKMETDDEIVASACIEEEGRRLFAGRCASNLHFKKRMCEIMVRNGTRAGTVEQCVRDRTFRGHVVEAGGVGGQGDR
jgi:hypothetical protein